LKKIQAIALLFLVYTASFGQSSYKNQIPKNWKIISTIEGDLNKDAIADLVLIIEDTNPDNYILNDGFGEDTLNINARGILVFFKDNKNNYTLIEKNLNGFILSQNSEESPCLADPLMWNGDVSISKNILIIHFNYWLSCGSWYVNDATYKFRFQHNTFELIGFDHSEFHRASGEESSTSINYSTKKMENTTGLNMFEESKPVTTRKTFNISKLYQLKECTDETYFEILDIK